MDSMLSIHSAVLGEVQIKQQRRQKVTSDIDGCYAWVIVVCSFFVFSIAAFNAMNFGVFAAEFIFAFGLSESEIGLIGALRLGISTLAGLLAGPLVQRFGCRRVIIVAIMSCAIGHVTAAFATGASSLTITFGFIAGSGSGLTAIPCIVLVQRYFNKKRALAASIASVGLGLFGIIASPLTRFLVDTYSWRGALLIFGGLNIQMLVPAALFRQPRKVTTITDIVSEEKDEDYVPRAGRIRRGICSFFDVRLCKITFILYCILSIVKMLLIDTYYVRTAAIGLSIGLNPWEAALLPSVVASCTVASRVCSGFLGQVIPPHVLLAVCIILSAGPILILPLLPHTFLAYVISGMTFGFFMGMVLGIQHTALVLLTGLDMLPLALSWVCVCTGVLRSLVNLFVGWLLDTTGSYDAPLFLASFTQLVVGGACGIAVIIIRRREDKHDMKTLKENNVIG